MAEEYRPWPANRNGIEPNHTARVIPLAAPPLDAPLGVWAEFYARLGWRVFPLAPRTKIPAIAKGDGGNGVHDATSGLDQVRSWWRQAQRNIGLACGRGLVVIDVDHRHSGAETLDKIMATHRMPATPFVVTADGFHFYLRDSSGRFGTVTKIGPGVEARGDGYYIVAPPSIHPSGHRYQWARGYGPVDTRGLPEVPSSLISALTPDPTPRAPAVHRPTVPVRQQGAGRPTRYGQKALRSLLQEIAAAVPGRQGDGRHDRIYRAAARCGDLIRAGHLDGGAAFDALVDAGLAVGGGDYSEDEIARTVRDGIVHSINRGSGGAA